MKRLSIIAFLILSAEICCAQVTLDYCREKAAENHPSIKLYGVIDATKDFSVSNAALQWLPSIRVGALAGVANNVPTIEDVFSGNADPAASAMISSLISGMGLQDPSKYIYKAEAELSQNIYDGGASKTAKEKALSASLLQKAEADVTQDQIRSKVDEVYFSILLLQRRILGVNSKIDVLESARTDTSRYLEAGTVRQGDLDAIDAAIIEAEQQLITLESTVESYRTVLTLLTGEDMSDKELIVPSAPAQVRVEPMTLLFDKQLDMLSIEKKQLDVMCRPQLSLVADAYYGYPNRNVLQDLTGTDPRFNAFVGLSLSWNLTSLYTRKNNLGIISASRTQINIKKEILTKDIQLQNVSINSEILRLEKCIEKDKALLDLRSRLRQSAELSYSQGTINANELVRVVDEEYQASLNSEIHQIESLKETFRLRQE